MTLRRSGEGIIYVMGGAGTGKSTMVRKVAPSIGARWFDTGCWYRALSLAALRECVDVEADEATEQLVNLFRSLELEIAGDQVRLDRTDVSTAVHGHEVTAIVSRVAGYPAVRQAVAVHQRRVIGTERPVILVGRSPKEPYESPEVVIQLIKDSREAAAHRQLQMPGSTHEDIERRNRHDAANMVQMGLHSDGLSLDATGLDVNQQAARFLVELERLGFAAV